MSLPRRATVVGLGLMGGSLARDLSAHGVRVRAYDLDPSSLRSALEAGVVEEALPASLEGIEDGELLVLAVPVRAAVALLERVAPHLGAGCLVTDLGSTKRSIGLAAERLGIGERFVGSHPMAGDHRSGWEAAREGLFAGARVHLCPTPSTAPAALEAVRELWLGLGARPEVGHAGEHDRRLAWTSHLPQLASSALARALSGGGHPAASLGPGGRDVTRLAGSSPGMWSSICLDNADALGAALEALMEELEAVRSAVLQGDERALEGFFAGARAWYAEGAERTPTEQSAPKRIP